eukprot:5513855-Amphidinium_carterae.1
MTSFLRCATPEVLSCNIVAFDRASGAATPVKIDAELRWSKSPPPAMSVEQMQVALEAEGLVPDQVKSGVALYNVVQIAPPVFCQVLDPATIGGSKFQVGTLKALKDIDLKAMAAGLIKMNYLGDEPDLMPLESDIDWL